MEQINQLSEQITVLLFLWVGMLATPLLFIALDYWSGIRKSKKRGLPIESNRMKRTVDKVACYYNAILAMVVIDVIQIGAFIFLHLYNGWSAYTFPAFTLLSVLGVAAIEVKSILEPADAKERRDMHEVVQLATEIAKHRTDPQEIAQAVATFINQNTNISNGTETEKNSQA